MAANQNRATILNARLAKKLLTPDNFTVLSVTGYKDPTNRTNAIVTVEVDLFPNVVIPMLKSTRYITRTIKVNRIDLTKALLAAGFESNEDGYVQVEGTFATAADFCNAVSGKISIDPEEIVLFPSEETTLVKAKDDSLGYTGKVILAAGGDVDPSEKSVRMIYAPNQYALMDAVRAGQLIIPPELNMPMENLGKNSDVEFLTLTETDMSVLWKQPDATKWLPSYYVLDGIKSIDDLTDEATVTIEYQNPEEGEAQVIPWGQFKYTASPFQDAVYMFSSMSQTSVIQSPVTVTIAGKLKDGTDLVTKPITLTWSISFAGGPVARMAKPVGNRVLEAYNNMKLALTPKDSN